MKRPLIIITVGYITGILWGLYLKINIVPFCLILLGGVILIKKENKKILIIFIIIIFISNIQVKVLEEKHSSLYSDIEKETFTGIIVGGPKESEYKNSYVIKIENINEDEKYNNTKLNLYVDKEIKLNYGQRINFIRRIQSLLQRDKL